jgi:pyruvate/2-oxoglutarate/acetoin dehydrogenase E1 component
MMVAMDAIVNHLDKIERISHGEFKVPVIIRAVVADGGPFYSGITHSQDFTKMFQAVLQMPIFVPQSGSDVKTAFEYGSSIDKPIMVVEYKSRY